MAQQPSETIKAELDIITEIPDELNFACPCKVLVRDLLGNASEGVCGKPCRAFPKTKAVQHAKPECEPWKKNHANKAWITTFLVAGGVAVQFAPDDRNYHGKPR